MLKRIRTEDVALGMFLHKLEGSWLSHAFWKRRFLLETQEQITDLRASEVQWVMIDTSRGRDFAEAPRQPVEPDGTVEASEPIALPEPITPPSIARYDSTRQDSEGRRTQILVRARQGGGDASPRRTALPAALRNLPAPPPGPRTMQAEMNHAAEVAHRSRQTIRDVLHQARLGKTVDIAGLEALVDDIMHSIQRHPHAFSGIVRLMKTSDYLHGHMLAVSALMINLAIQLGLRQDQVREAGLAGLLMDIGMSHVPSEIFDKVGELTPAEERIVQSHTMLARDCIAVESDIPESVVDACLHHHERFDGSGYPHGLQGTDISLFARMAAICDTYDAMTSRRAYRPGTDPAVAVARMREDADEFDPDLLAAFVRAIGIYPVGSLVRLTSEKLALVLDQNPKNPTLPRIRIFYSTANRMRIEQEDVDLVYRIGKDAIVAPENPADWGITDWDKASADLFRKATGVTLR